LLIHEKNPDSFRVRPAHGLFLLFQGLTDKHIHSIRFFFYSPEQGDVACFWRQGVKGGGKSIGLYVN
jgi:hypothetical protein